MHCTDEINELLIEIAYHVLNQSTKQGVDPYGTGGHVPQYF